MHIPVLLNEINELVATQKGETVVDATAGGGGHTEMFANAVGEHGTVIAFDADAENLARTKARIENAKANTYFFHTNFRDIGTTLTEAGIQAVDVILFDLGLSSIQLQEANRGFSFQNDEPLSMTFSSDPADITAEVILNEWDEHNIADILYGFGGERFSRRIAQAIAKHRAEKRIQTTSELVSIIKEAVPNWYQNRKIHPATKTFQALRIAANDEFGALRQGLNEGFPLLRKGGRIAVISYHSSEDRIVKEFFKEKSKGEAHLITKKPVTPTRAEIADNPKARSAKLRVVKKK